MLANGVYDAKAESTTDHKRNRYFVLHRLRGADRLEGLRLCGDSGKGSQSHQAAGPSDNQVHMVQGCAIYRKLGLQPFFRTHQQQNTSRCSIGYNARDGAIIFADVIGKLDVFTGRWRDVRPHGRTSMKASEVHRDVS